MECVLCRILRDVVDTIVSFRVGASPTRVKFLPSTGVSYDAYVGGNSFISKICGIL